VHYGIIIPEREKEIKKMKRYIITYTSYQQYKDHETYAEKGEAERRYEQLKNCKYVSNLKIKMVIG
jgi:hypothetical protein